VNVWWWWIFFLNWSESKVFFGTEIDHNQIQNYKSLERKTILSVRGSCSCE